MPLITTLIEPHGVTRIFFDLRPVAPGPRDQERIALAIETANELAGDVEAEQEELPNAA